MRVQKNKTYTINKSDIVVKILNVYDECDEYQKVTTVIYHKRTLDVVEGVSEYTLYKDKTKYWEEV